MGLSKNDSFVNLSFSLLMRRMPLRWSMQNKWDNLTCLSLNSRSRCLILSGRVKGIRDLLILVIHGCCKASLAVYLWAILNFVILMNKFLARLKQSQYQECLHSEMSWKLQLSNFLELLLISFSIVLASEKRMTTSS